ncbi:MAG: MBL fold metallo-hydrolase [Candidatus Bathyarchaeota archaeon]|nr:MBL fold metallo-hydrolase [Candidatus Bathyarchaeota archaeon]
MFFKQLQQHGDNFSYIIADSNTQEAAVVDSSFNAGKILRVLKEEGFALKYIISTHDHSDHTAGNPELQSALGGQTVAHTLSKTPTDLSVKDNDTLHVGKTKIQIIHTPGHTPDGICLLINGKKLLTGDTLFVGECGRTDLPGGNSKDLYNSLFNKLLKLNDNIQIYPGHDYGATPHSTIAEQRQTNYILKPRTLQQFIKFMKQP